MKPKKSPLLGPTNKNVKIVVVDNSNSIFEENRPLRDFVKKAIQQRLKKEKKLMQLKEKMNGKRGQKHK